MFRWADLLCTSIASALFVISVFVISAKQGCPAVAVSSPILLQSQCVMFYDNVIAWTFLCGAGLTILLLVIHLIIAAKKLALGWLIPLVVWPRYASSVE
jgi:hypothetical protein